MGVMYNQKEWKDSKLENKYWLALPIPLQEEEETMRVSRRYYIKKDGEKVVYESRTRFRPLQIMGKWVYHKLPLDVYNNKPYPRCECGRKFVPVRTSKGMTTKCQFCRK